MNQRGHGLVLHICKHICESLGGDITVKSAIGCGSTFTFRLKCYTIQMDQLSDQLLAAFDHDAQSMQSMSDAQIRSSEESVNDLCIADLAQKSVRNLR